MATIQMEDDVIKIRQATKQSFIEIPLRGGAKCLMDHTLTAVLAEEE